MAEKSLLNVLYPGSGMVLDCIDVRYLPFAAFLICIELSSKSVGVGLNLALLKDS